MDEHEMAERRQAELAAAADPQSTMSEDERARWRARRAELDAQVAAEVEAAGPMEIECEMGENPMLARFRPRSNILQLPRQTESISGEQLERG